ncbi:hypothetical protein ACP70R_037736 [Stipagrostis hirtigluma subsp. patula]
MMRGRQVFATQAPCSAATLQYSSKYTLEEAQIVECDAWTRNEALFEEWCEMSRHGVTPSHGGPIFVLPEVTKACVSGSKCYHRRFWTDLVSPTEPNHPNFIRYEMMQVFSLTLSSTLSSPVNIYGHFALRDNWEPLRNYLFKRSRDDPATIAPVRANCTMERAERIVHIRYDRNDKLLEEWLEMAENKITPLPVFPLPVLPRITRDSAPTHPFFRPCEMMQFFSLRLSGTLAHPVNVYGTFAVRDCWDPRRNYRFERSRDDPATTSPAARTGGFSFLPLRSPCRGIYVLQYVLIEVDLWIKEEGHGIADGPLFRGHCELDTNTTGFDCKLAGRLQGNYHGLDVHYVFLSDSIETVIEVIAAVEDPSSMKISASTNGFGDEIALYDGTFCGTGVILKHFIAVKKLDELHVFFKLDDSRHKWTFKAGVEFLMHLNNQSLVFLSILS